MRKGTHFPFEQAFLRRIVQVDVVFVWKHELDEAKRIAAAGRLAHRIGKVARGKLREIGIGATDHATAKPDEDISKRPRKCCGAISFSYSKRPRARSNCKQQATTNSKEQNANTQC